MLICHDVCVRACSCVCVCYVRLLVNDIFFLVWFGDCTNSNSSCSVASNFMYIFEAVYPVRFGAHSIFSHSVAPCTGDGVQNSIHSICHHMLF